MTYAERRAAEAAERERIAAEHAEAQEKSRRILQAAAKSRDAANAALETRVAREEDEAKARAFAAGDARLLPLVVAMHDEATNRGAVALIEAIDELDKSALAATGEVFPLQRVALLLAEVHRQARPGILEHLAAPRAWHSVSGGGLGGGELATMLRKAGHDVAAARSAFESLDAKFWSLSAKPVDEQALVAWQAHLQPDPRVRRAWEADRDAREREAQAVANAEACTAAIRAGARVRHNDMADHGVTLL